VGTLGICQRQEFGRRHGRALGVGLCILAA
jgi:hypothetical protein